MGVNVGGPIPPPKFLKEKPMPATTNGASHLVEYSVGGDNPQVQRRVVDLIRDYLLFVCLRSRGLIDLV